jgi:hypothetical protein
MGREAPALGSPTRDLGNPPVWPGPSGQARTTTRANKIPSVGHRAIPPPARLDQTSTRPGRARSIPGNIRCADDLIENEDEPHKYARHRTSNWENHSASSLYFGERSITFGNIQKSAFGYTASVWPFTLPHFTCLAAPDRLLAPRARAHPMRSENRFGAPSLPEP